MSSHLPFPLALTVADLADLSSFLTQARSKSLQVPTSLDNLDRRIRHSPYPIANHLGNSNDIQRQVRGSTGGSSNSRRRGQSHQGTRGVNNQRDDQNLERPQAQPAQALPYPECPRGGIAFPPALRMWELSDSEHLSNNPLAQEFLG